MMERFQFRIGIALNFDRVGYGMLGGKDKQ